MRAINYNDRYARATVLDCLSHTFGFTLIDLLVVIAVIGVLAALLLPSLQRANNQAKSTYCKNNLRQIGIGTRMYVNDDGHYPYESSPDGYDWPFYLQPYFPALSLTVSNQAVQFQCPCYLGALPNGYLNGFSRSGYAYNTFGAGAGGFVNEPKLGYYLGLGLNCGSAPPGLQPRKDSEVVAPSEMFAFMDTLVLPFGQTGTQVGLLGIWAFQGDPVQKPPQHGDYFNVASPDTHVEQKKITNLWCRDEAPTSAFTTAPRWNIDNQAHPNDWDPPP